MKAVAVFPARRSFQVIDAPEPALSAPTQVKLRMIDVGICGTDKEIVSFEYGTPPDGSEYLIIGHESLGEVIATGPQVSRVKPGDLVVPNVRRPCGKPECVPCSLGRQDFCYTGEFTERGIKQAHGYMAEFVVEDERWLTPVPAMLRDVAVLVEPLTIAEKGIRQLWQIQQRLPWVEKGPGGARGHNALVLGAGPVGLLGAMKLVREGFPTAVYSKLAGMNSKCALVASIGARFVDADQVPVEKLRDEIGSVDVVYEAVGASALAFQVMPVMDSNGAFIFTGVPGRKGPLSVDTDALMRNLVLRNQIVYGTVNADLHSFAAAVDDLRLFNERWPDALRQVITRRWPIAEAAVPLSGQGGPAIKNVIAVRNSA